MLQVQAASCPYTAACTCRWLLMCNWGDHSFVKLTLLFLQWRIDWFLMYSSTYGHMQMGCSWVWKWKTNSIGMHKVFIWSEACIFILFRRKPCWIWWHMLVLKVCWLQPVLQAMWWSFGNHRQLMKKSFSHQGIASLLVNPKNVRSVGKLNARSSFSTNHILSQVMWITTVYAIAIITMYTAIIHYWTK